MNDEEVSLLKSILWDLTDMVEDIALVSDTVVKNRMVEVRHKIDLLGVWGRQ